ncbi:transient receptor potential cation channel protein painless-like [Anopheles ziemanni]|uniref:transient receptor potential cation channel protein painless-like n=1 Tax=Anopheles coustani TaxID=139045 RepID=UPI00265A010F|nr:transient receptor potential cation channel protein painless-like [Anopheles coustani]XP_058176272.1 transient receptor potential cation channel protein painless-like [Anopheles ziemanni]
MAEGATLLNMEEPKRKDLRSRRCELQEELENGLKNLLRCVPPTETNLDQFRALLDDPKWAELMELVNQMKTWDVKTTIPEPKTFLNHTRFQVLLADMLSDIGKYEPYLKLFIERFEAENELVAPKQPTGGKKGENQEPRQANVSGKIDAPIHFAVMQLNEGFLEWLLGRSRTDVNQRNSHKETALAILCEKYDECLRQGKQPEDANARLPQLRKLIERLLTAGADFNICSMRNKLPIEMLYKSVGTAEVSLASDTKDFVHQCIETAKHALVVIKTEGNVRLARFLNNATNVNLTVELFEIFLRHKDVEQFQNYWPKFVVTRENVKKVIRLLLHTTLDQKLPECLRLVVEKNEKMIFKLVDRPQKQAKERAKNQCAVADQRSSEMEHRVELKGLLRKACEMGDLGVLQLLVKNITDLILLNDDPLLAVTLTKAHKTKRRSEDRADLLACAEYLADTQTIHMSKVDDSGNTPLHLALKYGFESVALALLKQRYAYLGLRNRDNLTPLDYGTYEFWKSYLDRCIEVEADRGNDKRMLRFNLNCFAPFTHGKAALSATHRGGGKTRKWKFVQDATSANHQPRRYERTVTEMTTVRQIAQSKELKPLLIHPVVHTFIMVKWMRLSHWNYLNLVLTVLTAVLFGSFSLTACSHEGPSKILLWFSALAALLMGFREILQMLFLRKSYMSFDNALDIANIVAMIYVLCDGCKGLVSSLVVISLALQVTFLLGSLPFNSLSTMMYMFKTVSINFLKSFGLFIPLIGAFIYAFYLTYNESPIERAKRDACTEDDCVEKNFNSFHTFWNATIKTLVMTSGELEASTLDFDEGKLVLFLLFLFIAPIVIMNLINGLAVSDIAAIREESELISISKKVMLLEQYERGVANVRPAYLHKLFPKPFFAEHNSWIQVRAKEFRKIEVHRKDEPTRPHNTTAFEPLSIFPLLGDGCSNVLLNFRLFKISLFMRLDQSILTDALAIHEKRHPFTRTPLAATVTSTSIASSLSPQRTPSPPVTPTAPKRVDMFAAGLNDVHRELQELKKQMKTLMEQVQLKPKRGKQHVKEKGLRRKARKRLRRGLRQTLPDHQTGDQ